MPEPSLIDDTQLRIMAADTVLPVAPLMSGCICAFIAGLPTGLGLFAAVCFVVVYMTFLYSRPRTAKPT